MERNLIWASSDKAPVTVLASAWGEGFYATLKLPSRIDIGSNKECNII